MLDLVLKLIEKCVDLAKRREKVSAELYKNFVAPAFKDFEAVHKNYLDSFRRYRALLSDTRIQFDSSHPIFAELREDSLFSHNLRVKLRVLRLLRNDPIFGSLLRVMFEYLNATCNSPLEDDETTLDADYADYVDTFSNIIRIGCGKGLNEILSRAIPESERRYAALGLLDALVAATQHAYENVVREFTNAKVTLLKPL